MVLHRRLGMAWPGAAWLGKATQAWRGVAGLGKAQHGEATHDTNRGARPGYKLRSLFSYRNNNQPKENT